MVLRYRVSLEGLKGFARVYDLNPDMTLYEFHKILNLDLEFAKDQLIQFKGLDENDNLVMRYGLFDLGGGSVDQISLQDTVEKGIVKFFYFYDVTNRKYVIITFEGEQEPNIELTYPCLIESKGPVPIEFEKGYVAFEDRVLEPRILSDKNKFNEFDDDEDDYSNGDEAEEIDDEDIEDLEEEPTDEDLE